MQVDLSHSKDFEPVDNLSIKNKNDRLNKSLIDEKSRKDLLNRQDLSKHFLIFQLTSKLSTEYEWINLWFWCKACRFDQSFRNLLTMISLFGLSLSLFHLKTISHSFLLLLILFLIFRISIKFNILNPGLVDGLAYI